jgi:hypothetical protein
LIQRYLKALSTNIIEGLLRIKDVALYQTLVIKVKHKDVLELEQMTGRGEVCDGREVGALSYLGRLDPESERETPPILSWLPS